MQKKKRVLRALIAACVVTVCLVPLTAWASDHPVVSGHQHIDLELYDVPGEDDGMSAQGVDFPEKLDPRTEAWYQDNITVRDQANSNLCWAFSTTTAAQISYAKKQYEETGEPQTVGMLSPVHLGYFFFNRANDPLNGTKEDQNFPGYPSDSWFNYGGNCMNTQQHLATWSGAGPDSATPFTVNKSGKYNGPMSFDPSLAYQDELMLHDSDYYETAEINELKEMVKKHGAAVVSIRFGKAVDGKRVIPLADYLNNEKDFYNPDGFFNDNNHEVTVIGWDDSYSRDNFSSKTHDSKTYKVTGENIQPKGDGAWIVQNSYGTEWGDNGYFYVSYESIDIISDGILGLDMQTPDAAAYNYQYDGNAYSADATLPSETKAANIFTAKSPITLKEIRFTEYNNGKTNYKIDIYTSLSDPTDPFSGIHVASQDASTETAGNKSIALDEAVSIDKDENWSIVITVTKKMKFGIERTVKNKKEEMFHAGVNKGQSLYMVSVDKIWNDAFDQGFCFRIKGIADDLAVHEHQYEDTGTVIPPTKSYLGYTVLKCSICDHKMKTDIKPMLDPVPNAVSLQSLTAKKKALKVKWKMSDEVIRGSHITGYKIRYSLKSNMKNAKTKKVQEYTSTSKKITGLQGGKKYYVQVCAYYKDSKGKTWCSKWSAKKSKKTKK